MEIMMSHLYWGLLQYYKANSLKLKDSQLAT